MRMGMTLDEIREEIRARFLESGEQPIALSWEDWEALADALLCRDLLARLIANDPDDDHIQAAAAEWLARHPRPEEA